MAQTALKDEEFTFPAGGIADFYMEDDEIAALEREEAEQAFGKSGIAEFGEVASRMASYGRGGDDTIAHVATGEIIIPLPLIENNPRMKASIFNHLRELGVEDPEQYVVGSSANSINPETGLAEFGWLKKTFKKVKKAVKKVVKSVTKVVKKIAPVVIPFALNMLFPGMGAIYSGALGAGIGTLVQGGNLKDAFKAALVGGAIGGATSAISGGLKATQAGGSFGQGAIGGIKDAAKLSNLTTAGKQLVTGQFGQAGYEKVLADQMVGSANVPLSSDNLVDAELAKAQDFGAGQGPYDPNAATSSYDFMPEVPAPGGTAPTYPDVSNLGQPPSFMDTLNEYSTKAGDYLFRGGQAQEAVSGAQAAAEQKAIQNTLLKYGHQGPLTTAPASIASKAIAAGDAALAKAGPGLLATYGPSAALAGTAAYAAGFFDAPKEDPVDTPPTGEELISADPEKYRVSDLEVRGSQGPTEVASPYTIVPGQGTFVNPFYRPQDQPVFAFDRQYAAEGGEIFPRRVGGIMPNEGIPGQDSVRAMLMPGEFVMTTDAVKGLGGGNMRQGINNMYDMMRGLESRGKAMA